MICKEGDKLRDRQVSPESNKEIEASGTISNKVSFQVTTVDPFCYLLEPLIRQGKEQRTPHQKMKGRARRAPDFSPREYLESNRLQSFAAFHSASQWINKSAQQNVGNSEMGQRVRRRYVQHLGRTRRNESSSSTRRPNAMRAMETKNPSEPLEHVPLVDHRTGICIKPEFVGCLVQRTNSIIFVLRPANTIHDRRG